MQCAYCEQSVAPGHTYCPKCGLPPGGEQLPQELPEDGGGWFAGVRDWFSVQERRVAVLLLVGACAAGAGVGFLVGAMHQPSQNSASSAALQTEAEAASPAPAVAPWPVTARPATTRPVTTRPANRRPAVAAGVTLALPSPAAAPPVPQAPPPEPPVEVAEDVPNPLQEAEPDTENPWAIPESSEPKLVRRQFPTEPGTVPPPHALAGNPFRRRQPVQVVVLPSFPSAPAAETSTLAGIGIGE